MTPMHLWHGWGMHPTAWGSFGVALSTPPQDNSPTSLSSALPFEAPLTAELPGYAGTPAPTPYTMDALVDALLADEPQPITLCGWSLGAMLALHAAQRHPHKVERLILISATPSFVQRADWAHGMAADTLAQFTASVAQDPPSALKRFVALFNQGDQHSRAIGRQLNQTLADHPLPSAHTLVAGLELLRTTDLRGQVPHITQPTLLLHGALDPLMPLASAQWLAQALPQAQLQVLPHAAHAPFLSDPAQCVQWVREFARD